jgi:amino acid permease
MVKFWGTTIDETINAFKGTHLGSKKSEEKKKSEEEISKEKDEEKRKATVRIAITFILLLAGIFFVGYQQGNSQTIGATIIGAITGYWLK